MNVIFIVNPTAGNGKALNRWESFKETLSFPYDVHFTTRTGEATDLAARYQHINEDSLLIAFGGDGTVHEVLEGVNGAGHCVVSAIMAGSGNDFARYFHTFSSASEIEKFLTNPLYEAMDSGNLHSREDDFPFVNNAGFGFDALVAYKTNHSPVKRLLNRVKLGKLSYTYFLMNCLFTYETFEATVRIDGKSYTFQDVWLLTTSNQPFFGGGMKISPQSNASDGKLEMTIVHNLNRWKLLFVFVTVFIGWHTNLKEVTQLTGHTFEIETDRFVHRHVDGEFAEMQQPKNRTVVSVRNKSWNMPTH